MPQYKVKAVAKGYYKDKFRNEGDIFWLHDEKLFSSRWMKSLDSNLEAAIKKDPKLREKHKVIFEGKQTKKGITVIEQTKPVQPESHEEEIEEDPPLDEELDQLEEEVPPSDGAESDDAI